MLTGTIYHVWPRPGTKTSTPRILKFTILVEAFLLYITMHSVFPPHVGLLRRFLKIGQFWVVFALATKPQGGQGP
jgi:hypothetical protein